MRSGVVKSHQEPNAIFDENMGVLTMSGSPESIGILTGANSGACSMLGRPSTELVGASVNSIIPNPFSTVHDDLLLGFLTGDRPAKFMVMQRNMFALRKNGTLFPVSITLRQISGGLAPAHFMAMISEVPTADGDHFLVYDMTNDRVCGISASASALLGVSPQQLDIGGSATSLEHMLPGLTEIARRAQDIDVQTQINNKSRVWTAGALRIRLALKCISDVTCSRRPNASTFLLDLQAARTTAPVISIQTQERSVQARVMSCVLAFRGLQVGVIRLLEDREPALLQISNCQDNAVTADGDCQRIKAHDHQGGGEARNASPALDNDVDLHTIEEADATQNDDDHEDEDAVLEHRNSVSDAAGQDALLSSAPESDQKYSPQTKQRRMVSIVIESDANANANAAQDDHVARLPYATRINTASNAVDDRSSSIRRMSEVDTCDNMDNGSVVSAARSRRGHAASEIAKRRPGVGASNQGPAAGSLLVGTKGPGSVASSHRTTSSAGFNTALEAIRRLALSEWTEMEPSIRWLKIFIRATFIVILVMCIVGFAVMKQSGDQLEVAIHNIETAGNLRNSMVEMKYDVTTLRMLQKNVLTGVEEESVVRASLTKLVHDLHSDHTELYLQSKNLPKSLQNLYRDNSVPMESIVGTRVDQRLTNLWNGVNSIIKSASLVVETPLEAINSMHPNVFVIAENTESFSPLFLKMVTFMQLYEQHAVQVAKDSIQTQAILMGVAVSILTAIVFFVFPPVVHHVNGTARKVYNMFLDINLSQLAEMQKTRQELLVTLGVINEAGGIII